MALAGWNRPISFDLLEVEGDSRPLARRQRRIASGEDDIDCDRADGLTGPLADRPVGGDPFPRMGAALPIVTQ